LGTSGTLHAQSLGRDCHARFTVGESAGAGAVRVRLDTGSLCAGLQAAFNQLENRGREAA